MITVISVICQIGRILVFLSFIAKFFKVRVYELFPLKLIVKILIPSIGMLLFLRYIFIDLLLLNNLLVMSITFIVYVGLFGLWVHFSKLDYLSIIKPLLSPLRKLPYR
jgi:hypothetical protein